MTSKIISVAVALVVGGAAINAGPAAAGPIGTTSSLDVASPNLVLEVKQRVTRERLAGVERPQGAKLKRRKRVVTDLEEVRAKLPVEAVMTPVEAIRTPVLELRRF